MTKDEIYYKASEILRERDELDKLKKICASAGICYMCGETFNKICTEGSLTYVCPVHTEIRYTYN